MRYGAAIALLATIGGVHAASFTLAVGGRPAATIVVPPDAPARIAVAARDLQHYVGRICGVELPLRDDGRAVAGPGLYVGACQLSRETDLPGTDLNPEAYAIRVRDGSVFFAGRYPTPTAFAVMAFLEDDLGVRWFAPGEAWEYVPAREQGELTVEVAERVVVPGTSPRIWSGHAWNDNWKAWNLRNKTVLSEVIPRRQFQNNLYRVFPPSKYGEAHPEYYPLINGQRWIPASDTVRYWRPCESNPEVVRLTVEYARRWLDAHPDIDSFSLGMDDIAYMCGCDNCRALDPHPDSYEKRQFSDRHYKFINAVAREIAKTHPDRYIGTLIYSIARELPETVDRLEDNVFGFITETSALWWQEGRREADHELSREWAKRCRHLSRYDYYGMGTITPRVYPHTVAEQIKFDKSLGFEGMYTEVYTFLPHTAPMIWAFAKLQWDHTLDVDALLDEFYAKMFGPAAGTMKRYWTLLEDSWNTPRPGREGWVHRSLVRQALAISPEAVDEGMKLLEQAAGEAEDDLVRGRIETVRAALEYASYPIRSLALSNRITSAALNDAGEADQLAADVEELMRLSAAREQVWKAAPERDDLLGETVRGLGGMGYLALGQASRVEAGGLVGALKVLQWYRDNTPDRLAAVSERLLGAAPGGDVARAVKAWLWLRDNDAPNLIANPGFEDQRENREQPEKDWETEGAPPGWSLWKRTPDTSFVVRPGGRNGSHAASIAQGGGGTYLYSLRVEPGQRYFVTAWCRTEPPGRTGAGSLSIRFQTAAGAWYPRRELEPSVGVGDGPGWQPLMLFVSIPEEAGKMVVMLTASHQEGNECVLYDDVAAYRLPDEGRKTHDAGTFLPPLATASDDAATALRAGRSDRLFGDSGGFRFGRRKARHGWSGPLQQISKRGPRGSADRRRGGRRWAIDDSVGYGAPESQA